MAKSDKFLVIFYCVSAGQNGPELGSDEEEIVYLIYWVIDLHSNQVVSRHEYPVKPHSADINENILSEQCRDEYKLTEANIKTARPLEEVLHQFHIEVVGGVLGGEDNFTLVTDGQLHLRQCLFPEAQRKNLMPLPSYYYRFHDLRKEFMAAHTNSSVSNIPDMLNFIGLESVATQGIEDISNMAKILEKLFCDGFKLHDPDYVQDRLEQGIRSREDSVDTNCCVRARGLPWQASDMDIARFFVGLNIAKGGVALCLSNQGRRNGEALVLFENGCHKDMAIKRHKHHIGNRYIEVYKATGEDFIGVAGGNNKEAQMFLSQGAQVIIRMRGLPYNATPKEVIDFFANGDQGCKVLEEEGGVLFVRKPDGRATGDAFVLFAEEDDAEKALQKHKEVMGTRYIELFRSTTAEVQQVLNRTMEVHSQKQNHYNQQQAAQQQQQQQHQHQQQQQVQRDLLQLPLISTLPIHVPVHPHQQVITAGTLKDCIRLRGLPYEADVEQILNFLGEHGKNIVEHGIHMVVNAQGHPSGEAFIQMRNERDAFLAAQQRHHQFMIFGKKQRYIEVFQCSGDDMNHLLTGSGPISAAQAAALAAVAAQAKAANQGLLPPGMLPPFPGALPNANLAGLDQQMANQLQNQFQYLTNPNLANLANPLTNLYPGFQPARPSSGPSLAGAFPPGTQIRPPFPGDSLWAFNPSGMTSPLLSLQVPTSVPSSTGLTSQPPLLPQNFQLNPFLLPPNAIRLPTPQIPVTSAGSYGSQNVALLQTQLAAQRFLMQQHQPPPMTLPSLTIPQQQPTMSPSGVANLTSLVALPPPPNFLPPISTSAPISLANSFLPIYTTTAPILSTVSAPKRTFDQAFVPGANPLPGKRVNYGYGVLAAAPTISAAPTTYYAPAPNAT